MKQLKDIEKIEISKFGEDRGDGFVFISGEQLFLADLASKFNELLDVLQGADTLKTVIDIAHGSKEEWPSYGDEYVCLDDTFNVCFYEYRPGPHNRDEKRKIAGNCFRTEAEALEAKERIIRVIKG